MGRETFPVVVHFSENSRRHQMSYDENSTVANAFNFAALHIAGSRHSPDARSYHAYTSGQRVPFDALLIDLCPRDIEFRRITPPFSSAAASPAVKKEAGDSSFPMGATAAPPGSSNPASPTDPSNLIKRSRVAALIDAALIKAEESAELLTPQAHRPQPAAEDDDDDDGVIVLSDEEDTDGEDGDNGDAELSFVIGSVAQWQGPRAPETKSHQWTVYVRGDNNEDLSPVIEKVEIRLHDTFSPPVRVITEPPFEVTERGWGQFTVGIRIFVRGVPGPNGVVSTTHFISFSPRASIVDAAGRVVPKPPGPVAGVGNRAHCIPPYGLPFSRSPDVIPPFALIKAPVVVERREALVVRNPPQGFRDAVERCSGRPLASASLTAWPEIKAHLAVAPGAAWAERTADHALEVAELSQIRDALAMEVSRTLLDAQTQQQRTRR